MDRRCKIGNKNINIKKQISIFEKIAKIFKVKNKFVIIEITSG